MLNSQYKKPRFSARTQGKDVSHTIVAAIIFLVSFLISHAYSNKELEFNIVFSLILSDAVSYRSIVFFSLSLSIHSPLKNV